MNGQIWDLVGKKQNKSPKHVDKYLKDVIISL